MASHALGPYGMLRAAGSALGWPPNCAAMAPMPLLPTPTRRLAVRGAIALAVFWLPLAGSARAAPDWPDSFAARLAAQALVQELRADLLSEPSATATLERWCRVHTIAPEARITAARQHDAAVPPSAEQRARLQIDAAEPVGYRHVRLICGGVVLSEAENWYVPSRLTQEMNRVLDSTDTPFGKAVQALAFKRATLSSRLLWRPLPEDWATVPPDGTGGVLGVPAQILQNRALLSRGTDGLPFAEVVETYTSGILAFPLPLPH